MKLSNSRISSSHKLVSPKELRAHIPITPRANQTIIEARNELVKILEGSSEKFVVITGPCSIHDPKAAYEYAGKLNGLREKYADKLFIVMRIYFEKPRTIKGWKGLIYDPFLNNSYDIDAGLKQAREILIRIADMGLPAATEMLDPIIAGYVGQLAAWVAIGARTTESQTHRQMCSGLSAPVGFKNGTNGDIEIAINAIKAAEASHHFIGVDDEGSCSILQTSGNPYGHIVLRGGGGKPNYHIEDIDACEQELKNKGVNPAIIVDCSHDNSNKDYRKQHYVVRDIITQKKYGNKSIKGIMLESNLFEGKQAIGPDLKQLKYGVSVTDGCIGWKETERLIELLYTQLP